MMLLRDTALTNAIITTLNPRFASVVMHGDRLHVDGYDVTDGVNGYLADLASERVTEDIPGRVVGMLAIWIDELRALADEQTN